MQGEKQILLIPPSYYSILKPHPINHPHDRQASITLPQFDTKHFVSSHSSNFDTSRVNISHSTDSATHNKNKNPGNDTTVLCYTGTVYPGDLLYIPYGWWHEISSPSSSISITNRWNPYEETLKKVRIIEQSMKQGNFPMNLIVSVLRQSEWGGLPDYVKLWSMRRSELREEFIRLRMLDE